MTKYVLQSGGVKNQPKLKKLFHEDIVEGLGDAPKILMCNFAQGREYWEAKFKGYCDSIKEDVDCNPVFQLAMPDTFFSQAKWADIIYFHGGDDHLVQYWMRNYDLGKVFKDKVVATNSASSNMLCVAYWTCDWREGGQGFGVLPIKFIPHYRSSFGDNDPRGPIDWDSAYEELKVQDNDNFPIYALKEGEFVVFEDKKQQKVVKESDL